MVYVYFLRVPSGQFRPEALVGAYFVQAVGYAAGKGFSERPHVGEWQARQRFRHLAGEGGAAHYQVP